MTVDEAEYVLGMEEAFYHAQSAISASGLKVVLKSPKHFQASRRVRVEKPAFDVGHAIHARVLGVGMQVEQIPQELLSSDGGIRSNAAKERVAKIRAAGKVPLKPEVYRQVVLGAESVLANPKARRLLELPGDSEVSMFATDPETGLRIRGRADRITEDGTIIDLKSAAEISLHKLLRVVDDYSYDLSMEMYRFLFELCKGSVAPPTVLIFVEKTDPYDVRVVRLGDDWIEGGWQKLRRALEVYKSCVESGVWPGVDAGDGPIEELPAPSWYAARVRAAEGEVL